MYINKSSQIIPDQESRYLITTADERTWVDDKPVLFLGEWCRLYSRKEIWSKLDAIVSMPYGLEEQNKDKDYAYIRMCVDVLLVEISDILNSYHGTNHTLRYWRILLGNWLYKYISVILNRWHTLQQALDHYTISGTTVLDYGSYSLATQDSLSFVWACNDDIWNHVLSAKILKYMGGVGLTIIDGPQVDSSSFRFVEKSGELKKCRFSNLVRNVARCTQRFSRNSDAFIINSYLPLKEEIDLQLKLRQVPQLWQSPGLIPVEIDTHLRKELLLDASNHYGFEKFIRIMLMKVLPACYLEGYKSMIQQVNTLSWPKNPKFIFTSNNFEFDEIFKAWTGEKVEKGVPYYTGQHGNNYGTVKYCNGEDELVKTSDKFITWGWSDKNPNVISGFNFKVSSQDEAKFCSEGGLLLIEVNAPHRISTWDEYYEFGFYQEDQFRFVDALPGSIKNMLVVRLHSSRKYLNWSEDDRWRDYNANIKIEPGSVNIKKLILSSRLVVHSYDSTGLLETLTANIPTLCFWRDSLKHIRPSERPLYDLLRKADIITDKPEQAAEIIALNWDHINIWWGSQRVQSARKEFCDNYSRIVKSPAQVMKKLLLQ